MNPDADYIGEWQFKYIPAVKARNFKPVIEFDLNYKQGLAQMTNQLGTIIPVIVNKRTMNSLNPIVLDTYIQMGIEYIPVLFVVLTRSQEVIASLAVNGGLDGFLTPSVKQPNQLIDYLSDIDPQLIKAVAPLDYLIETIDMYLSGDTPAGQPYTVPTVDLQPVQVNNDYDIPTLDIDRQITTAPVGQSWVGWGATPHDRHKQAVHFYVEDKKFSALAGEPEKIVKSHPSCAIEVNYSTNPMQPRALVIYNTWQKRTLSKTWQELGIKVAVDLCVTREFFAINLLGVPRGWKAFANRAYADDLQHLFDAYEIAKLHAGTDEILYFVYGREQARQLCEQNNWQWIDSSMYTYGQ